MSAIPKHVRTAFQLPSDEAVPAGVAWGCGWHVGQAVVSEVVDPVAATWSARVRDQIQTNERQLRVARPMRATDGRYVVAGWRASIREPGVALARVDETVQAALRLDDALADVDIPTFVASSVRAPLAEGDLFLLADRAAWAKDPETVLAVAFDADQPASPHQRRAMAAAANVGQYLEPMGQQNQVTHADMLGTTIYDRLEAPLVTDLYCAAHPHGYSAAQVIVDALIMGLVDARILRRFRSVQGLRQLCLHALQYRIYLHALHERAKENVSSKYEEVLHALVS